MYYYYCYSRLYRVVVIIVCVNYYYYNYYFNSFHGHVGRSTVIALNRRTRTVEAVVRTIIIENVS